MQNTMKPERLQPGDRIGITAPAGRVPGENVEAAMLYFKRWGLDTCEAANLLGQHYLFSGTDQERANGFQSLLQDASVKAIFCARGGYGTVRMMERVDFAPLINQPKWITGYSDITAIHLHLYQNYGLQGLHAPMASDFLSGKPAEPLAALKEILFGGDFQYQLGPFALNKYGHVTAPLTGGNLSVIYSLTGTRDEIQTDGKILFLEEIGEYDYHIDRMMVNLKQTGKLGKLKGLIIGHMTGIKPGRYPFGKTAYEIIASHVKEYGYPVCYGFPAGHEAPNYPLIIGREAELECTGEGVSLRFV